MKRGFQVLLLSGFAMIGKVVAFIPKGGVPLSFFSPSFITRTTTRAGRRYPLLFMQETDRQEAYRRRNYTWPPQEYVPNTPGWRTLMERRIRQIQSIPDLEQRYNGWISVMTSAQVMSNFTQNGFALTRAPRELLLELQTSLNNGLLSQNNKTTTEREIEIIRSGSSSDAKTAMSSFLPPLWIEQEDLNAKVLKELRPIHSKFVNGMDLVGAKAYGLRVYRNQSTLLMHTDKPDTHIVASILHISHSEDSQDWPIVIEDYQGRTHEIVMEAGDMLLYESAKVYHGRPYALQGSWYCSIFTHYYPVGWDVANQHWESHYAVPPCWFEALDEHHAHTEELEVVGTGVREPNSKHGWQALEESIKWHGPVPDGGGIYNLPPGGTGGSLSELR